MKLLDTLDALSCGVLVEDGAGGVAHTNRVFREWFGEIPRHQSLADRFIDFHVDLQATNTLTHRDGRSFERRLCSTEPRVWEYRLVEGRPDRGLLAQLGHELRTPLNATIGLTELALDTELEPRARTWLSRALANAESTLDLVANLLDWSRIEAGEMGFSIRSFNAVTITRQVVEGLVARAEQRSIALRFSSGPIPTVRGDAARWRQIVSNLVANAIKYTPGGRVDVHLDSVEFAERVGLSLRVRDTGIGISPEDQERIFQRFYRANHTSSGRMSGTGLGLAITRSLVELMEGQVTVVSEVGLGSTFTASVVLPRDSARLELLVGSPHPVSIDAEVFDTGRELLERCIAACPRTVVLDEDLVAPDPHTLASLIRRNEGLESCRVYGLRRTPGWSVPGLDGLIEAPLSQQSLSAALKKPPTPSGARVLVVDDAPDGREVLLEVLRRNGHRPVPAEDGLEAVLLAGRQRFDLILMDLDMPHVDGIQATARIREEERLSGSAPVRIIALTAHDTPDLRASCEAAGMDGFYTKPVSRLDLDTLVGVSAPEPLDLDDLLPLFTDARRADLAELIAALDGGDMERIARIAHRMKGAAATLDVAAVESIAQQLSASAHRGDSERTRGAVHRLARWLEEGHR